QRADRVDQRVHQVAVALPPPQQDDVHHLVGLLVEQLVAGPLRDGAPEFLVGVLVVPELLDHLPGLDAEALSQAPRTCLVRRRAHCSLPPCTVRPGEPRGRQSVWRWSTHSGALRASALAERRAARRQPFRAGQRGGRALCSRRLYPLSRSTPGVARRRGAAAITRISVASRFAQARIWSYGAIRDVLSTVCMVFAPVVSEAATELRVPFLWSTKL